jgi:hypothetical protein
LAVLPIEDVTDCLDTIAVWPAKQNTVAKDRFVSFLRQSLNPGTNFS